MLHVDMNIEEFYNTYRRWWVQFSVTISLACHSFEIIMNQCFAAPTRTNSMEAHHRRFSRPIIWKANTIWCESSAHQIEVSKQWSPFILSKRSLFSPNATWAVLPIGGFSQSFRKPCSFIYFSNSKISGMFRNFCPSSADHQDINS